MTDLSSAEKQFRDALPKLAEAAESEEPAAAFREHRTQTLEHIERLERGFELLGKAARSETCEAAKGPVAEGKSAIDEERQADEKLHALGQRLVEHVPMSA